MDTVLVVEDSRAMQRTLQRLLEADSLNVQIASDGISGLESFRKQQPSAVLLDLKLPGLSGKELCREFKTIAASVPIVVLSANAEVEDKVLLLELGADDYVTKPFSPRELLARVRALGRRRAEKPRNVLEVEDVVLDTTTYRTFRGGREIHLSLTEFRLLELLVRNRGAVVSRHSILETLWGSRRDIGENTIDAFIRLLRKKLDDGTPAKLIQTHRGFGYSVGALN